MDASGHRSNDLEHRTQSLAEKLRLWLVPLLLLGASWMVLSTPASRSTSWYEPFVFALAAYFGGNLLFAVAAVAAHWAHHLDAPIAASPLLREEVRTAVAFFFLMLVAWDRYNNAEALSSISDCVANEEWVAEGASQPKDPVKWCSDFARHYSSQSEPVRDGM